MQSLKKRNNILYRWLVYISTTISLKSHEARGCKCEPMTHCSWQGGFKQRVGNDKLQRCRSVLVRRPDKARVSARHTDTRLLLRKCLCLCTVYCLCPRAGCADKTLFFAHSQSSLSSAALTPECSIHTYPCLHTAPLHDKRQGSV